MDFPVTILRPNCPEIFAGSSVGAFPQGALIDAFTGADSTTLPAHDANWVACTGASNNQITSNSAASVGGAAINTWAVNFGPDLDIWADIAVKPADGNFVSLFMRAKDETSAATIDGYTVSANAVAGTDTFSISVVTNGTPVLVGTAEAQEFTAGDSFGARLQGSTFQIYYKAAAGSWTALGSTKSDGTWGAAGKIGLYSPTVVSRIDNISAGTL